MLTRRQAGRSLVVVLIAVAIVGWLVRDALVGYIGSINGASTTASRHPPGAQPAIDATRATPTPTTPIERARAVEGVVLQQHEQSARRIDGAAR